MEKKLIEHERQQRALAMNNQILESLALLRTRTIILASALKEIFDNELYKELDCETFEIYCCQPEISLQPSTAKHYIAIYRELIETKKIDIESVKDISMNKLELLRKAKNPEKYLADAKALAYSDFKKEIYKKELKINLDDDEVERYIKKNEDKEKGCPHWDGKKCKLDKK